jgi:hypothetical protein
MEFNGTAEPVPFVQQNQPDFARPRSLQSNQQIKSSKSKLFGYFGQLSLNLAQDTSSGYIMQQD